MGIAYYAALGAIAVLLLIVLGLILKLDKQIIQLKKEFGVDDKKNKSKS